MQEKGSRALGGGRSGEKVLGGTSLRKGWNGNVWGHIMGEHRAVRPLLSQNGMNKLALAVRMHITRKTSSGLRCRQMFVNFIIISVMIRN